MAYDIGSGNISYFEYKAINELMHAHIDEFGKDFRAMIVFGPLVTEVETYDIDLLEVINNWEGPEQLSYGSTQSLPLRGTLRLHFLSSSAFEDLVSRQNKELLDVLREGYDIVCEVPAGYAREVLKQSLTPHTALLPESVVGHQDRFADPRRPLLR